MTEKLIDAYSADDVLIVGAGLVKLAEQAAEQFPGAANLAMQIAEPLLAEVKRHRDAAKKAAEKGAKGPCETKGFVQ